MMRKTLPVLLILSLIASITFILISFQTLNEAHYQAIKITDDLLFIELNEKINNLNDPADLKQIKKILIETVTQKDDSVIREAGLVIDNFIAASTAVIDSDAYYYQFDDLKKNKKLDQYENSYIQRYPVQTEISKDSQRDELTSLDKEVSKLIIEDKASTNKQLFTFIYNNIFLSIDAMAGHLDIM